MSAIDLKGKDVVFEKYYDFLIKYNEITNLTAITDKKEVFIKHFLDSISGEKYIPKGASVLDIGTGAGFPGIPLKIVRNDIRLTLVDSLNKRITFLNELKPLINCEYECIHSRAEDFAHSKYRESFDVVVARAVAKLNTLCEYTLPLVQVGGIFIAYKGSNYKEEIEESRKAIKILGGELLEIHNFNLPNESGERALIIIKKCQHSHIIYPRNKNLPKTKPII